MRKFVSYIKSDKFAIGCTGGTVYVYDLDGNELAKFKDIKYGYDPMFNPVRNEFVVKSTEGRLAYYSLDEMKLVKKFRFSKVDGAQDDSFCFSKDGNYLFNIERHIESYNGGLSVYDLNDFSTVRTFAIEDEKLCLGDIQCDELTGKIYVLGCKRNNDNIADKYFAATLGEYGLENIVYIPEGIADYYHWSISLEINGFTEYSLECAADPPEGLEYKCVRIKDLVDEYNFVEFDHNLKKHMDLLDLSYYFVPEEAFLYDVWQQKLQPIEDLDNWNMLNMGDTNYQDGRSIGEHFDCIGELMWQLKISEERLAVRTKTSKWREKYRDTLILSSIEAGQEVSECLGGKFAFIYEKNNVVNKVVTVSSGEIVECYYRKELEAEVERVFSKWANKTEYYKYELGE